MGELIIASLIGAAGKGIAAAATPDESYPGQSDVERYRAETERMALPKTFTDASGKPLANKFANILGEELMGRLAQLKNMQPFSMPSAPFSQMGGQMASPFGGMYGVNPNTMASIENWANTGLQNIVNAYAPLFEQSENNQSQMPAFNSNLSRKIQKNYNQTSGESNVLPGAWGIPSVRTTRNEDLANAQRVLQKLAEMQV